MPFSGDGRVAAIETGEGVIEVESFDNVEPQVPESRSEKKKIAAFEQVRKRFIVHVIKLHLLGKDKDLKLMCHEQGL